MGRSSYFPLLPVSGRGLRPAGATGAAGGARRGGIRAGHARGRRHPCGRRHRSRHRIRFSNARWADYKTGEGIDPVLYGQFQPLEEALGALGVVVWPMVRVRGRRRAGRRGSPWRWPDPRVEQVVICTPDKDLAQCVRGDRIGASRPGAPASGATKPPCSRSTACCRSPLSFRTGSRWWATAQTATPGLPGWGARSAAMVLARYRHLEAIPTLALHWDRAGARCSTTGHDPYRATRARASVPRAGHPTARRADQDLTVDGLRWAGPRARIS